MEASLQPIIPEVLSTAWEQNEGLREAHARIRTMDMETYMTTSMVARQTMSHWDIDKGVAYVDIRPEHDEYDEHAAIFLPHPFVTGWGSRAMQMAVRAETLLAAQSKPQRLIAFPGHTVKQPALLLSKEERGKVAHGDFTPIGERMARTIEHLGITAVSGVGYSQGATTAANTLAVIAKNGIAETGNSGIFEPASIVNRSILALGHDFTRGGMAGVYRAMHDADIPLLMGIQPESISSSARTTAAWLGDIADKQNVAIARGLSLATLQHDIRTMLHYAPQETSVLAMRAEQSRVTPRADFVRRLGLLQHEFGEPRMRLLEVGGYGHELGDHVIAHALLARMALEPATGPEMPDEPHSTGLGRVIS